jgi:hypothetical protein
MRALTLEFASLFTPLDYMLLNFTPDKTTTQQIQKQRPLRQFFAMVMSVAVLDIASDRPSMSYRMDIFNANSGLN